MTTKISLAAANGIETLSEIIQGPDAGRCMFIDPTFGDLLYWRRIKIMQLLAAAPKRDDELGLNQQIKMFADALPGHIEMAAKLVESLAVIAVKVIQECSAAGVSEGFENSIHAG